MTAKTLQVLLIEDNAGDARLILEMFRKERADSFKLQHFTRMMEAESFLAAGGSADIVLLDMGLPDADGLDSLRRAQDAAPGVPLIVLTGLDDEALASNALKAGAQDYLIKGQIENRALPRALRHAIDRHRMQAETDRIRAQQMQLRDEFLSHVSHELRSPLTSIHSFSTIIADGLAGETSPQQNEYLQIILRNVDQLRGMVEDLLDVGRLRTGRYGINLQSISISEVVAYTVPGLQQNARDKQIALCLHCPKSIPFAYADPTRLQQVLVILIDNATKFTPPGGKIDVYVRLSEHDPRLIEVEVADTGCGIPAEETDRVFEHLYQVADSSQAGRKGLGLGLHIAQGLVAGMGGKMWVQSTPQKGSHFYFTIPIFSIEELISPILGEQKPGAAVTLLTAEIKPKQSQHPVSHERLAFARSLIQQCLRPDSDVLMPTLYGTTGHPLLFVVAYTQEQGGELIAARICNHFRRHEELQLADVTFAVTHTLLTGFSLDPDRTMEGSVKQLAAQVEDHMNARCTV